MGASAEVIARDLDWGVVTIRKYLNLTGGLAPASWKRPDYRLSLEDRIEISIGIRTGQSNAQIAARLGRDRSTIGREITKGQSKPGGARSSYRVSQGQRVAWNNRRRPKAFKITDNQALFDYVQQGLKDRLSPEQIGGRLVQDFPEDPAMRVHHETIYRTLYLKARGGLERELNASLRTGRTIRHPKRASDERRGRIKDMVSIHDRPEEALDRQVPGHWEGDLIVGKNGASAIATIVERHSNYLILVRLEPGMNRVQATTQALVARLGTLPQDLKRSLAWDQGSEMHQHTHITEMTGIQIYFADPHSPWQRPSNENTNGLLREYFPKGTDLSIHTQATLDAVAAQLNRRPRKRLDYNTPDETLAEYLPLR
ncbi:IS30 family transposase [Citricoccus sp. NPDC055426]|uniref:IS30 family transposase n=1 Tax=Citricoccus sp. NPDC055426 TaxID=3155536 RepID=UPI003428E2BB